LDKTDDAILGILREDARLSYVEIAGRVGLSEAAVRRRVSNLTRDGVIKKFTVEVNEPEQTSAITYVAVSPSHPTSEVSREITKVAGVQKIYETTGQFDIATVIRGSNIAEVNKSVEEIRRIDGVLNTNTSMILRVIR